MSVDITGHVSMRTTVTTDVEDLAHVVANLDSEQQALFLASLAYDLRRFGERGRGYQLTWIAKWLADRPGPKGRVVDLLLDLNGYIEGEPHE